MAVAVVRSREYAVQLMEKQKVKYMYGIRKQFENLFHKAAALPRYHHDNLLACSNRV
jgi:small subunit ribosomal protein S4